MEHSETRSRADTAKRCCAHLGFEKSATVYIPVRFSLFPYPHLYNQQKLWIGKQPFPTLFCFNYSLDAANYTVEWGCDPWLDCGQHVLRAKITGNTIEQQKISGMSLDLHSSSSIMEMGNVIVHIRALDYWKVLWKNLL